MKGPYSVLAPACLAGLLLASVSVAANIGTFCSITDGNQLPGGNETVSLRPQPTSGTGTAASPRLERWFAFTSRNTNVGFETIREIWQGRNLCSAYSALPPLDARRPILQDLTGVVSYTDPAWSADGKWLAYVTTDGLVTQSSIYVQQYNVSTNSLTAVTALGGPILVADGSGGVHHRHPAWNASGTQIAYDSDASGLSIDLWTVDVSLDATAHTGTVNEASRTRHQLGLETDPASRAILNGKAEFKPAYSPDGTKIAYVTNQFGPFQIRILTPSSNGLGESVQSAETNFALIVHDNPAWSSDGLTLYYDAPRTEDPANPIDIWRLNLATGQKYEILDCNFAGFDADVSKLANVTADGTPFNYIAITSSAGGLGVNIWRGSLIPPGGVADNPPVANSGGPYSGTVGVPVNFNGTGSYDPDGEPLSYTWDFGDGTTGTGPTPIHTYTSGGVFTVTLDVADSGPCVLHATSSTFATIKRFVNSGPCTPG